MPDLRKKFPPELWQIAEALAPHEVRLVGGAVRNYLTKKPCPSDLDLATTAPPKVVQKKLLAAGIKALPTGLDHGTITAVIKKIAIEITTLRADISTDGRHAKVKFTADWEVDSKRRDFTFNAIYLGLDGQAHDFHNGVKDLQNSQVKFIGNPAHRIAEDYLRILRFYRFVAMYGLPENITKTSKVLSKHSKGLPNLSKERVKAEIFKLLEKKHAILALKNMQKFEILSPLNLEISLPKNFEKLDLIGRYFAVFGGEKNPHIALSNLEKKELQLTKKAQKLLGNLSPLATAIETSKTATITALILDNKIVGAEGIAKISLPKFPLKGQDILNLGLPPSPKVGEILNKIYDWWLRNNFPHRASCLDKLHKITK